MLNKIITNIKKARKINQTRKMGHIFIRMPRTSTTSIIATTQEINNFAASQMGFIFKSKSQFTRKTSNNLSICVRNCVGKSTWSKSYKFTVVRNPFDRVISMWKHKCWRHIKTFQEFCDILVSKDFETINNGMQKCYIYIKDDWYDLQDHYRCIRFRDIQKWHIQDFYSHLFENGIFLLDGFIRYENLQQDFNKVCDKIGIQRRRLYHYSRSKRNHYTKYYDNNTREMIAKMYAKDY